MKVATGKTLRALRWTIATGVLTITAVAAPAEAKSDLEYWQAFNLEVGLGERTTLSNETILRMGGPRGFYEVEDNLMLGYKIMPRVAVALGYTHDPTYFRGSFAAMEHRFRQQVTFSKLRLGRAGLSARVRLEERWREGRSGTGWRLRPFVKASLPIAQKVSLVASHESFLALNTTGFQVNDGLERMRNMVGVNWALSKKFGVEVGYLEQHGFVDAAPDTDNHALTVSLSAAF